MNNWLFIKFIVSIVLLYVCDLLDGVLKIKDKLFLQILLRLAALAIYFTIDFIVTSSI